MTTKEEIQLSINSRLITPPTQIEGGTMQDIIGSVSYELANIIDTKIDVVLDNAFVTTADKEHLLIKGKELGLTPKEAKRAHVIAKITDASSNTVVKTDIKAKTDSDLIFQVKEETITDESGTAYVRMECLESGSKGNIEPSELNAFFTVYEGFENAEITNETSGYDGFEEEDIESFRQRVLEYIQDETCNSNIASYKSWAKSVSGVKNVVVKDATFAGAGHVNVYVSAVNNAEVTDELIKNVEEKIKKEQIINASVTVSRLQYFEINIDATLALKEGASLEVAKNRFNNLLADYLSANPPLVSYLFISNLFFEIPEITDVSNYTLNNGTSSIEINDLHIPIKGTVNLNEVGNDNGEEEGEEEEE